MNSLLLPEKLLVFGGEALQTELIEGIKKAKANGATNSELRIVNHYGPTETTIGKLLNLTDQTADTKYGNTIPIGKPFSNTSAYVLSKDLKLCPVGVPGELYIAGDGVARGYFNNEELTRQKFVENPFEKVKEKGKEKRSRMYGTGDLVKYLPDGNIEFLGRVDEQVKIRGYRIELGEIESILQQSKFVSQAVVIAREDKQGNKRLTGYIVPDKDESNEKEFDKEAVVSLFEGKAS